jgi:hypothetical protein
MSTHSALFLSTRTTWRAGSAAASAVPHMVFNEFDKDAMTTTMLPENAGQHRLLI